MNDPIEQKILEWCRTESAKQKRVIGMRDTAQGAKIVRYLDTMGNSYVSRYGVPEKPLRFDPDLVLAHGPTWADVAATLGIV